VHLRELRADVTQAVDAFQHLCVVVGEK